MKNLSLLVFFAVLISPGFAYAHATTNDTGTMPMTGCGMTGMDMGMMDRCEMASEGMSGGMMSGMVTGGFMQSGFWGVQGALYFLLLSGVVILVFLLIAKLLKDLTNGKPRRRR